MKIGYVRVSTLEQNPARQETIMKDLGVEKVFLDKLTGKNCDRPQLQAMLDYMREGDTVVVESFSRFARSTKDLLELIDKMEAKGVSFESQKEKVDTSTPAGRFMVTVFAALAQLELETTKQRQAEGIAEAKAAGKYKGRKPIAVDKAKFDKVYKEVVAGERSNVWAMKQMGLKKFRYYEEVKRYRKEYGLPDLVSNNMEGKKGKGDSENEEEA